MEPAVSASKTAIGVENLRFGYDPDTPILDVDAFHITRGERVFLHGPSGSGKTTFLQIVAGILDPQQGEVTVLGHSLARQSGKKRDQIRGAHIGYIFQMFNLIPYLDVRENITLPCRLNDTRRARVEGGNLETAAEGLAERLGIRELMERPVTELSVGQQQRVAAARALLGRPEIIIADEPTSALDEAHRRSFLELLFAEAERAEAAVLFVSHESSLAPLFTRSESLVALNRQDASCTVPV